MRRKTKNGLLAPAEQPASRDQGEEAGPQENQRGGTGDSRRRRYRPAAHQTHLIDGGGQLKNAQEDRVVAQQRSYARYVGRGEPYLGITLFQEGRDIVQLAVQRTAVGLSRRRWSSLTGRVRIVRAVPYTTNRN